MSQFTINQSEFRSQKSKCSTNYGWTNCQKGPSTIRLRYPAPGTILAETGVEKMAGYPANRNRITGTSLTNSKSCMMYPIFPFPMTFDLDYKVMDYLIHSERYDLGYYYCTGFQLVPIWWPWSWTTIIHHITVYCFL